ncbi:MAG: hypothetical protein M3431_12930 [Actinomycetota bacterium]|nr:hypothetical protein [Actinomycetota bacterium]
MRLVDRLGRTHRYHVPPDAARVLAGLTALRDHVIAPILAGVRSPRHGRKPSRWTAIDRDYEQIRITMQNSSKTSPSTAPPPDNRLSIGRRKPLASSPLD